MDTNSQKRKKKKNCVLLSMKTPVVMYILCLKLQFKILLASSENEQKPLNATIQTADGQLNVVRGRIKDEKKSSTFNQLWTIEEQKRYFIFKFYYSKHGNITHIWSCDNL